MHISSFVSNPFVHSFLLWDGCLALEAGGLEAAAHVVPHIARIRRL